MIDGIRFSELGDVQELKGTEMIPIVDGNENKKLKADKIATKKDISAFATKVDVDKKNNEQDEKLRTLEGKIGKAIDHGTGDTTFELTPNDLHVWGEVASLNLTLAAPTENNEYNFQFTSGTQPTTLSLPSEIKWIGSDAIEASKTYQVSILNNIAIMGGV